TLPPPAPPPFPYTTLFRSIAQPRAERLACLQVFVRHRAERRQLVLHRVEHVARARELRPEPVAQRQRDLLVPHLREASARAVVRSEEHTSELQSRGHLVCR